MNISLLPKKLKLVVTSDDVNKAVCESPTKCMYAMALRRLYPSLSYVRVNPNGVSLTLGRQYYHYRIPIKGAMKLLDFDKNKKIDHKKATITIDRVGHPTISKYEGTDKEREYHRLNSARRRADPNYTRPDAAGTLRARVSASR